MTKGKDQNIDTLINWLHCLLVKLSTNLPIHLLLQPAIICEENTETPLHLMQRVIPDRKGTIHLFAVENHRPHT